MTQAPSGVAGQSVSRSALSNPRLTILVAFFTHAFAGGAYLPRIPDIQVSLSLSETILGLVLIGQAAGALSNNLFASYFIERLGPKRIISVAIPMLGIANLLLGLAPNALTCFLALVVFGFSFGAANMAINVEADRVESETKRRIMNRCHGVWGLGFLLATSAGALARGLDITPFWHFAAVLPPVLLLCALVIWPMRASAPRAHTGAAKKSVFVRPTLATLLLFTLLLASIFPEVAVRAWSVIYMRDTFTVPEWYEALTLPAFLLALTVSRLVADSIVERFGPVRVAAILFVVALAGLLLVAMAPTPPIALIGFAIMGLGLSVIFPLTMSAAAQIGDRPASQNVTAVALMANISMLALPALTGLAVELIGIRGAFLLSAPVLLVGLLLVKRLARPGY